MTSIYVLQDEPTSSELAIRTAELVGERYPVQSVDSEATLLDKLPGSRQAVVLANVPVERLMPFIQRCRSTLPGTSIVALSLDETPLLPVLDLDCHFLAAGFSDFDLLSRLASAVRQSELLATVANTAQLDEVTNLFNRHYFMQRLSEELSLSKRHLSPLCCVILGIDYYRMYLDSYGYSFINGLLRFLADKINGMIRHEDLAARIGDEEIAILLPRSTETGARIFTTRLVESLNQLTFKYGTYVEDIAVNAGLVGYPLSELPHADADAVVRYGRHALHQAKTDPDDTLKVRLFSEIRPEL